MRLDLSVMDGLKNYSLQLCNQSPTASESIRIPGGQAYRPMHGYQPDPNPPSKQSVKTGSSRFGPNSNPPEPNDEPGDSDDELPRQDRGFPGNGGRPPTHPNNPGDPGDPDGDGGNGGRDSGGNPHPHGGDPGPPGGPGGPNGFRRDREPRRKGAYLDEKLKVDDIPKWDGDTEEILRWFQKVNSMAKMSPAMFVQLGKWVPRRLTKTADSWYWSLPEDFQERITANWDTLRNAIGDYFMTRKWMDQQKANASKARYRDAGHLTETPSEYFIRKTDLLNRIYTLDDSGLILEVMEGAPPNWATVLTTQLYRDVVEFQQAIKYHEDTLIALDAYEYRHIKSTDNRIGTSADNSRAIEEELADPTGEGDG